jgi:hypothetical protein
MDEPQPLHTGGIVSAPVFGEVAEQAARYLGIYSTEQPIEDRAIASQARVIP